ncbi:MAG: hypothetical protein U0132_17230 [Gemmatimonadaceae bacterium]
MHASIRFAAAGSLLLLAATTSRAQSTPQKAAGRAIPDAVTADRAHYTVEFENAEVRVLRIRYGPHEKGNMHDHPRSVTVFLTDGTLRMTLPDGSSRVGNVKAGSVVWENAGPHQPENLTDRAFEAVRTEFKAAPASTPPRSK